MHQTKHETHRIAVQQSCIMSKTWNSITSGRSEAEGRRPSDLADLTELRIFSPTLDKSISPPWNNKKGTKNKTPGLSKPSLKSPLNKNGFPKTLPKGNRFCCISNGTSKIKRCETHFRKELRLGLWIWFQCFCFVCFSFSGSGGSECESATLGLVEFSLLL